MKKLQTILFTLVILVGLSSCENLHVAKLKHEIEAANKQCPVNMGMMGDMLSMKYDDNAKEVQLYMSLNEDMISIDALQNSENLASQSMKLSFSCGEYKEMLKLMINAGSGLAMTFKSASSGKSFKVNMPLDELKDMVDNPMKESEINRLLLENQLAMENSRCPYSVDEGMEMEKAFDDGDNIIYVCRIDEDMYDISAIRYAQAEIKDRIKDMFTDPVMKKQIELMQSLGKGFTYRYYGDASGEIVEITFTKEELRQFVK